MATLGGTSAGNHLIGTAAADLIYGNGGNDILEGRAGNDKIYGGAGDDRIIGGLGVDTLDGGTGRDTFVYTSTSESPGSPWGAQDLIVNWEAIDRIDLSAIDANTLVAGNQAFAFKGHIDPWDFRWHGAGNLYILDEDSTHLTLVGYTNNDWTPDIIIDLIAPLGASSISASNIAF